MRYEAMTGLSAEQLTELVARVHTARGGGFSSVGRAYALGLFGSVALVVCLMRKNVTQAFAGAIFGVSQATVSRRWDLLRPLIAQVLAEFIPHPSQVVGAGTVLVDGTICPTRDWRDIPDLFSAKAGYAGMNIQIAATLSGRLAAVGPIPVHGARHDAHAFRLWPHRCARRHGDRGGLGLPRRRGHRDRPVQASARWRPRHQTDFNIALSKIRAAVEHAIAHLKTWRMLSEEGGRYRAPIQKYQNMLKAVTGLYFFAACE